MDGSAMQSGGSAAHHIPGFIQLILPAQSRQNIHLEGNYEYKIKSRIEVREIQVTMKTGSKKTKLIDEKQVIFWSKNYADKAKAERDEIISRAQDVIADPKKIKKARSMALLRI